jgi:two-component system response regulator RegA
VKFGALDYLPKPADADDIMAALLAPPGAKPTINLIGLLG